MSNINKAAVLKFYVDTQEYSDRLTAIEAQAASSIATHKTEVAAAIAQVNLAQSQTITALTLEASNLKTNLTASITATQTDLINRADQLAQNVTNITQQLTQDKAAFTQEIQDALVYLENAESVASALRTPRKINGTDFDGRSDITTNAWGATRTFKIGNKANSINGTSNVDYSLADIGAFPDVGGTIQGNVEVTGNLSVGGTISTTLEGTAARADKLQVARKIQGVDFDGTKDINLPTFTTQTDGLVPKRVGATSTKYLREDGTWVTPTDTTYALLTTVNAEEGTATTANTISAKVLKEAIQYHAPTVTNITGNAGTATKLQTPRTINGISFDGTQDISLPVAVAYSLPTASDSVLGGIKVGSGLAIANSVLSVGTLNQSTTGNAATATKLKTARTISLTGNVTGSVNFDGSANASITTAITGLGAANGIATLDSNGKVPSTQLPSYVDDVLEFLNVAAFPAEGETGKIYVETTGNTTYRWSGTAYIKITSGEVSAVAGKTGVVTLTKADVGLDQVDNTPDTQKPISTATQLALNGKVNKSETYTKQESDSLVNNSISTALTPVNSSLDLAKRGVANRYDSSLTYNSGERVVLANGDIVKSTIDGNVNDPNVAMAGWINDNSASQIFDESGKTQQEINKLKANKVYVDSQDLSLQLQINQKAETEYVDIALSNLSTVASKFYPTLAGANAGIANLAVNQVVNIGESANGGLWYKATAGATSLTKSAYDPLTQAKLQVAQLAQKVTLSYPTLAAANVDIANISPYAVVSVYNGNEYGLFKKVWSDSTVLDKVEIDSISKTVDLIDRAVSGSEYKAITKPPYTLNIGYFGPEGLLYKNIQNCRYTSPIYVSVGTRISFKSSGTGYSPLMKIDHRFHTGKPLISMANTLENHEFTYIAKESMYISICGLTASDTFDIDLRIAPSLGLRNETDLKLKEAENKLLRAEKAALTIQELVVERSTTGRGVGPQGPSNSVEGTTAKGMQLFLCSGEKLTFQAKNYKGVILSELQYVLGGSQITYPIYANTFESDDINTYEYIAHKDMTVRISGYVDGTVQVNNAAPFRPMLLGNWLTACLAYVNYAGLYSDMILTAWFSVSKGQIVRVVGACSGTYPIVVQYPDTTPGCVLGVPYDSKNPKKLHTVEWVADSDCKILISAQKDAKIYLIENPDNVKNSDFSFIPSSLVLGAIERVFATSMNYILKLENVGGVEKIATSEDLGKTWKYADNILGDITAYHFFSDGTIMLCSPTKVFWSTNYTQWNESTVYDHDGSIFVPTGKHFFAMQTGDKLDFVGDTEIHSWGDYVDYGEARIWYTVDNGRTIKCSIKFGVTPLGGVVRSIRHTHRVYYHAKTNYWYLTTGDGGSECMIIRGRYEPSADTWDWQILASGIEYKFGNIMIDDNNIAYVITDYTDPSLIDKKGVYRVHASNLGDISKYRIIYKCDPVEWGAIAPLSLLMDNNGNKVLLPDYLGGGFIWIARDGLNFKRVNLPGGILIGYTIGENYNGDVYCVVYDGGSNLRLSGGTYNLTRILRENGITDFMRGTKIVSGLTTCLS